ncbi:hypothetical protein [Shewanella decolorationis]|uniref:hypothetical protein n=1 Tax=Shewanella decolorationis TaxID=256839 RepID=UPI00105718B1|nr:hypothetical protein [Shewanella decolorationis]
MVDSVKFAWGINSVGQFKHVSEVPNGNDCLCYCIQCGGALCAKNKVQKVTAHFSHQVDCNCVGESIIHVLAKKIIEDAANNGDRFYLPEMKGVVESLCDLDEIHSLEWNYGKKYLSNYKAQQEVRLGDLITDVLCIDVDTNEQYAVEIYRTHKKDDKSIKIFKTQGMMAVELDLSDLRLDISREELVSQVLVNAPRRWLNNTKQKSLISATKNELDSIVNQCNSRSYSDFIKWFREQDLNGILSKLKLTDLRHVERSIDITGKSISYPLRQEFKITDISEIQYPSKHDDYLAAKIQINEKSWFDIVFIIGKKADYYTLDIKRPYVISEIIKDDFNDYMFFCEAKSIDKWTIELKRRAQRELNFIISNKNNYIEVFQNISDQQRINMLCHKIGVPSPTISGRYSVFKPHWNTCEYVWKALVYLYFICKHNDITTSSIAENDWFSALLDLPNDERSSVQRSKDIYYWFDKRLRPTGLVFRRRRLKFEVNDLSPLYKNIRKIEDIL